jgi:hypothetical protein
VFSNRRPTSWSSPSFKTRFLFNGFLSIEMPWELYLRRTRCVGKFKASFSPAWLVWISFHIRIINENSLSKIVSHTGHEDEEQRTAERHFCSSRWRNMDWLTGSGDYRMNDLQFAGSADKTFLEVPCICTQRAIRTHNRIIAFWWIVSLVLQVCRRICTVRNGLR